LFFWFLPFSDDFLLIVVVLVVCISFVVVVVAAALSFIQLSCCCCVSIVGDVVHTFPSLSLLYFARSLGLSSRFVLLPVLPLPAPFLSFSLSFVDSSFACPSLSLCCSLPPLSQGSL
jgi:hypothetical protein